MSDHPLKNYRAITNRSIDSLAKEIGTSRITLWRIENRKQVPSLGLVAKIVRITNGMVRADDFLPSEPPPAG